MAPLILYLTVISVLTQLLDGGFGVRRHFQFHVAKICWSLNDGTIRKEVSSYYREELLSCTDMKRMALILAALLLGACVYGEPDRYRVRVVKDYPHDVDSYTQGLFFWNGGLYESTGQWGKSTFRKVNLTDGKALKRIDFDRKYFLEGSAVLDGKLYLLTWTNKVAFIYDASALKYVRTCKYEREGWGLTTDGSRLIASDGSQNLYFMDSSLRTLKVLKVTLNGRPVKYLNELEWVDGRIWANVYLTNMIFVINPDSGEVESVIDCDGLLPDKLRTRDTDVLNGIAYEPQSGKIYLTGKNWPRLYEVELRED